MITEQEHQFNRIILDHFSEWSAVSVNYNTGLRTPSMTIYAHHTDKFAVQCIVKKEDIIADPELAAQKAINHIHRVTAERNANNG